MSQPHISRRQVQVLFDELLRRFPSEQIPQDAFEAGLSQVSQALSLSLVIPPLRQDEDFDLGAMMNTGLDLEPIGPGDGIPGGQGSRPQSSPALVLSKLPGGQPLTPPRPAVPAGGSPTITNTPLLKSREPAIDPSVAPADDEVPTRWGRYPIQDELAKGGQGRILNAWDEVVGRQLALKILRREGVSDPRLVRKFKEEAMVTGQLEHPNIVPVHELGALENGLPYYTMKKVEGRTLKKIVQGLRKGVPPVVSQFGRMKLLTIMMQVCQAISFAHEKGVIHRDLKPANIMLGDYGEVIVLDWGVAKLKNVRDTLPPDPDVPRPVRIRRDANVQDTQAGTVEGTPAYMAPEQARGRIHEIDERSDVYALGAILYELLTYRPPFRGQDVREVLRQVVEESPPHPNDVAPQNLIPDELIAIVQRCLAKNSADRYPSVRALSEDLEAFIEGTKRRAEATKKVQEARQLVDEHQALKRELQVAKNSARLAGLGIQGWEPIERKRGLWATLNRVRDTEARISVTFGRAVALFMQALAHEPDNSDAKAGLADLYLEQLKGAELADDHAKAVFAESMVVQYHQGRYKDFLLGDGFLSVDVEPRGAEVWLYEYEEQDRVLRPVKARRLGLAPVREVRLPRGSYLLVLRAPGVKDVYYPVKLGRLEHHRATVRMYTADQIGPNFILIPGSTAILGGDLDAIDAHELERKLVSDFAIQEYPVTFREYVEFLNAWQAVDPGEALRHVPQLDGTTELVILTHSGWVTSRAFLGQDETIQGRPGAELDIPVFGVDWDSADAYCAWRSEITGREFRLPTEEEWEKAARGVDGRRFPWGSHFDPVFCKSRASRPFAPLPEPVGRFPVDQSPYGVRYMAGGVREWCDGWYSESQGLRTLKGGAWVDTERNARCASRSYYDPHLNRRISGFRCVRKMG